MENKKEQAQDVSDLTGYPVHIPFEQAVGSERDFKLSEIADSVRFIPLETTDASPYEPYSKRWNIEKFPVLVLVFV